MKDISTPHISVIIPVWNPGQGISRCIDSLRNQTLKEIEMIFVDDCGTDDSMDKVRAAAAEDNRIRIIENEENIGPGPSRNKGIDAAQGEYLSFVDPDDYVAPDFLQLLYSEAQKKHFDIVKGSILRKKSSGFTVECDEKTNSTIHRRLSIGMPLFNAFTHEHQSAIYRNELIRSTNVKYGLSRRGEDSTFLLQVCSQAKSFSIVDEACYYYCERESSAIQTMSAHTLDGLIQSTHEQADYVIRELSCNDWAKKRMEDRFMYVLRELDRYFDSADSKRDLSSTINNLRQEWLRLPFHDDSVKNVFPLYALQEHGCLLPREPFYSFKWESSNPPMRYAKLLKRWVDYFLEKPEDASACSQDLLRIIVRAKMAVKGKPYTTYSIEERRQGERLLKTQLERLPYQLRVKVYCTSVKLLFIHLLPDVIRQRLRNLLEQPLS